MTAAPYNKASEFNQLAVRMIFAQHYLKSCAYLLMFGSLICACAPKSIDDPRPSALALLSLAEHEIRQENYAAAIPHLDSALAINPKLANLYVLKSEVLEKTGDYNSAIASLEKYLEYRSNHPPIWKRIAKLHTRAGRYEQAHIFFKRYLVANPDSVNTYLDLAETNYQMGEYQTALNYLLDYRNRIAQPAAAYWRLQGFSLFKIKEFDAAIAAINRYIAMTKPEPEAIKFLGMAKFETGLQEEAMTLLNSNNVDLSKDAEVYVYRAKYFSLRNKNEAAREQLNYAIQLDGECKAAWFERAVLEYKSQQFAASQRSFERLLQIDPEYWEAYRYLGFIAEKQADTETAGLHYRTYMKHTENDTVVSARMDALKRRLDK